MMTWKFLPKSLRATLIAGTLLYAGVACWAQTSNPLHFSASYTEQSDSNLFRLPAGADVQALTGRSSAAEQIGTATLGAQFSTQQSLQSLNVNFSQSDHRYKNFSYLNFQATNYDAVWRWAVTPRLTGDLIATRNEALNSFADFQGYQQRNLRVEEAKRLDLNYEIAGPWHLIAGQSFSNVTNEQRVVAGSDYNSSGTEAGLEYQFTSGNQITLLTRVNNGNYQNRTPNPSSLLDDRFQQIDTVVRTRWNSTGSTFLDASLTAFNRTHPNYSQRDFSAVNTLVNLNWAVTAKVGLAAGFSRDFAEYQTSNASYSQTDRISIAPVWQISTRTRAQLQHQLSNISYSGAPPGVTPTQQQDITRETSLSLTWQAHTNANLIASLQNSVRTSNLTGQDYESAQLLLTAQLNF